MNPHSSVLHALRNNSLATRKLCESSASLPASNILPNINHRAEMQSLQNRPSHSLPTESANKERSSPRRFGVLHGLDGSSLVVVRADSRGRIMRVVGGCVKETKHSKNLHPCLVVCLWKLLK